MRGEEPAGKETARFHGPPGEHRDCSSGLRTRLAGWTRRLAAPVPPQVPSQPAASTLETFFAGIRWSEDRLPDGRMALRPASM